MEISAIVLVSEGFDDHPNARFPLMIFHDRFVEDAGRKTQKVVSARE
jgi:hypothetical protein